MFWIIIFGNVVYSWRIWASHTWAVRLSLLFTWWAFERTQLNLIWHKLQESTKWNSPLSCCELATTTRCDACITIEGTVKRELELLLGTYIVEKQLFTLTTLNARLQSFQYGFSEAASQPSALDSKESGSFSLRQSGKWWWCFGGAVILFCFLYGWFVHACSFSVLVASPFSSAFHWWFSPRRRLSLHGILSYYFMTYLLIVWLHVFSCQPVVLVSSHWDASQIICHMLSIGENDTKSTL